MDETDFEFKPPYLSFQTFWNFLTDLTLKPLPPQIDRSLMQSKSGSDQANLTAAMKSFGFTQEDMTVDKTLQAFHDADEEGRKTMLAELVKQWYPEPLRVSESDGTPKQLEDTFKDAYGLDSADTRRKAITFFLHAARTAEIPLTPNFPKTRPGTGAGTSRKRTPKRKQSTNGGTDAPAPSPHVAGETKIVDFGDIGTVTVNVAVKWLELPTEKMISLRKIVDELEKLGAKDLPSTEPDDASAPSQDSGQETDP